MTANGTGVNAIENAGATAQILEIVHNYTFETVGIVFLVVTVLGVYLGLAKKAVFYADYNDLALSAGIFALPVLIIFLGRTFVPPAVAMWVAVIAFVVLFGYSASTTFRTNKQSIWKTIVLSIAKLVMSFLFVFHLFSAFTSQKWRDRGGSIFFLVLLTPLLIALVSEKKGFFALTTRGRLRTR